MAQETESTSTDSKTDTANIVWLTLHSLGGNLLLGDTVALPRATVLEDVQELLQEGQPCFVRVHLLHGCVEVKHSSDLGHAEHINVSVILQQCILTKTESEEYRNRLREAYWSKEMGKKGMGKFERVLACYRALPGPARADMLVTRLAVIFTPQALTYSHPCCKNNANFILHALTQSPSCLRFADQRLKQNRDFLLQAVKKNPVCLKYMDMEWQEDHEIMLKSIEKAAMWLLWASESCKADRSFALQAVSVNPLCLEYLRTEFRSDREIVLRAVQLMPSVIRYAEVICQEDPCIIAVSAGYDTGLPRIPIMKRLRSDENRAVLQLSAVGRRFLSRHCDDIYRSLS